MKNNFNKAYNLINKDLSEDDICQILQGENDTEKAGAILMINSMENPNTAELLIYHLTNQTGQIRELCAYKINQFINKYPKYFQDITSLDKITASINDVNPNVVRFMLDTLKYIDNKNYIFNELLKKITEQYIDIINKHRRGKVEEHIFTKKCFKIYWSLEGIKTLLISNINLNKNSNKLGNILSDLAEFEEYTIREKVAQIVNMLPEFKNSDIKKKLMEDENYFVKRQGAVRANENINC